MNQSRFDFIMEQHPKRIEFIMLASESKYDATAKICHFISEHYKNEYNQFNSDKIREMVKVFVNQYIESSNIDFETAYKNNRSVSPVVQNMYINNKGALFFNFIKFKWVIENKEQFENLEDKFYLDDPEIIYYSARDILPSVDYSDAFRMEKEINEYKKVSYPPKAQELIEQASELLTQAISLRRG